MPLADFEQMFDFSKSSLSSEGIPVERSDKTGTAKLSEGRCRGIGPSSAAAELRKTFCGPKGKIELARKPTGALGVARRGGVRWLSI